MFSLCCLCLAPSYADLNPLLQTQLTKENKRVVAVLAPNMLLLEGDEKIRLIGLRDMPSERHADIERDKHGFVIQDDIGPVFELETQAMHFVRDLVMNERVRLEFDVRRRNQDHHVEAYVFLADDRLLNEEILRAGYADLQLVPPNMKYAEVLRQAYREASQEQRGIQGQW